MSRIQGQDTLAPYQPKNTALLLQFYRHLVLDARPQLSPSESDHARASLSPPPFSPSASSPCSRSVLPASAPCSRSVLPASAPTWRVLCFFASTSSPSSSSNFSMPGFASREKNAYFRRTPSLFDPDLFRRLDFFSLPRQMCGHPGARRDTSAPGVPERGSTSTQRGLVDTPL